jgi:N-acetylmuramoyl-L-alanine amidase
MKSLTNPIILSIFLLTGCATTAPTPSQPQTVTYNSNAQQCMALAMYWEARGEGVTGMVAVGSVIMNRVDSHEFPDSTCGVVRQGGETPPCQFSWWCDGKSDKPQVPTLWLTALNSAESVLTRRVSDPTGGALFFHNTSIKRPWQRTRTTQIGGHIFYR